MPVNKNELDKAIHAALNGPEIRDVRFAEYRFNVKPVKIEHSGGTMIVVGGEDSYISRRRRARANDRIFYEFEKRGGIVNLDEIDIDIDRGGVWRGMWRHRGEIVKVGIEVYKIIRDILEERKGKDATQAMLALTSEEQDQVAAAGYEESKKLLDGSWEGEATFLVMNIALKAK